jgi:hypothetical protein
VSIEFGRAAAAAHAASHFKIIAKERTRFLLPDDEAGDALLFIQAFPYINWEVHSARGRVIWRKRPVRVVTSESSFTL